jgi:hypothetical protein
MGKRVKAALVLLTVALVGVIVCHMAQPREPVYKARSLRSWVGGYAYLQPLPRNEHAVRIASGTEKQEIDEAMRAIGTNAIPTLLCLLRSSDSALKLKLVALLDHQHIITTRFTLSELQNLGALMALRALGTNAGSAVPALTEFIDQQHRFEQPYAIGCLGAMGPSAQAAVPSLLRWMTNADREVRAVATNALRQIQFEVGGTNKFLFIIQD